MNDTTPTSPSEPAAESSSLEREPQTAESADEAPAAGEPRDAAADERAGEGPTSIYVRRGRTPTLGFWVVLALAVPALGGLVAAPLLGILDLGGMVNLALLSVLFIGVPLAAVAALADLIIQRRRSRRR